MHRTTKDVLENAGNVPDIDEPLRVKGTNRALLSSQPALQGSNGAQFTGGLVADGVTPLLFRISTSQPTEGGTTYQLVLQQTLILGGRYSGAPAGLLKVEGSHAFVPGSSVTLSTARPDAFVLIQPVRPEDLQPNAAGMVQLTLELRDAGAWFKPKASYRFALRRPPVALVHGYNVENANWGTFFTNTLETDRQGFVKPVGYGLANDLNTTGSLWQLAGMVDQELRTQIEKAPWLSNWAVTRYDAVGHSQGGVLLRMLCSQNSLASGGTVSDEGFVPFRNADNFYRGRFRRVVTIGSPHAGSTLAEMGIQLKAEEAPNRIETAAKHAASRFPSNVDGPAFVTAVESKLKRLFQSKFRIGEPTALSVINDKLQCDPYARLHLLRTTIYDGLAPGQNGADWWPLYYSALYLNDQTPIVNGLRPGQVVAPNGSDGVVDSDSQGAGAGGNHTTAITGENIIHADVPILPDEIPDTESSTVAQRVRTLLNGAASEFGTVTIPATLKATMLLRAANISSLAQAIKNSQSVVATACFASAAPAAHATALSEAVAPRAAQVVGDMTLHFALQPPAGESLNGTVEWAATVYGPAGATASPTLVASGTFGEQLVLTIPASVQGQVVLSVCFPSTTGMTVIGAPQVVLDRPPGTVLTGLSLAPAVIESQAGAEVALAVSGIYDGTISSRLFTNAANTTFQSSNAAVATVDAEGRVKLLALGTATITANYNGTLTATTAVTVLDVAPIVTSAASVSGTMGQAFSHQLTASQAAQSFAATPLPPGLTLNTQTGLIDGTPTTQGATSALVSVTNANGTGSRQVDLVITGPAGAPTDVGLDASAVSEQKPVGTLVGRFVTVDPNPLDTFIYQLVTGTGSTDNASFSIVGDQLFTAAVLDRATQSTVSIRVRTTDSSAASFEKAIVLPVMAPPAITRQPDPQRVFAGETVVFAVEASGIEPLSYQWKRDGADVPGATSRIFQMEGATAAQAGSYSATVTNGDGAATSAPASLVVDPISYGKWVSLIPSAFGGATFEPLGDYNGDGVANFIEFAFGVPPNLNRIAVLPVVSREASGFVLSYWEANGIEPLIYKILESVDLVFWQPYEPALSDVTRLNQGNVTQVRVRIPAPNTKSYFRVSVSTP